MMPGPQMKVRCKTCGWQRIICARGEALLVPRRCERCGSVALRLALATVADRWRFGMAALAARVRRK